MIDEPSPIEPEDVARLAAALLAFGLPAECRPGVAANLAALAQHARRVAGEAE